MYELYSTLVIALTFLSLHTSNSPSSSCDNVDGVQQEEDARSCDAKLIFTGTGVEMHVLSNWKGMHDWSSAGVAGYGRE
jgi:hypothetical protein